MNPLVYFSSSHGGNTERFIQKLDLPAIRLPIEEHSMYPMINTPYVLLCPTYADGEGYGAVPRSVIHFLNEKNNRDHLRGVIASGNRNFGKLFARAGDIISQKCAVPILYRFELAGTEKDIRCVQEGLTKFWKTLC